MQDRHDVNKKAMEYAKQVGGLHVLHLREAPCFSALCGNRFPCQHLQSRILLAHGYDVSSIAVMWLLQLQAMVLAPNKALPHVAACISMGPPCGLLRQQDQGAGPADTPVTPSSPAATATPSACPCAGGGA